MRWKRLRRCGSVLPAASGLGVGARAAAVGRRTRRRRTTTNVATDSMRRAGPLSRATPSASSSANLRASEAATCSSAPRPSAALACTGAGTASSLAAAAAAPSRSSSQNMRSLWERMKAARLRMPSLSKTAPKAAAVAGAMAPDSGCRFHSSGGSRCASFARAGSPAHATALRAATATMASTWSLATRYRQRRRGATGATMVAMASACIIRSGWR